MSEILYTDVVGTDCRPPGPTLHDIALCQPVRDALLEAYGPCFCLSPPQTWSIENGVLTRNAHYLVVAPTNSGKTFIALLRILERAIDFGRRFVYVVPLKALAEEKAEEIEKLCEALERHGGPKHKVVKSTGDYQLTSDFLGSPPPESGEIIICTPERLEVIARDPDNISWLRAVDTFVIDEFHLLGEKRRGAALECLVTRALTVCPDASIVALSATIGNPGRLGEWLAHTGKPVHVHESDFRYPPLHRSIIRVGEKNAFVISEASKILENERNSLLVFVYRKSDAERLAKSLAASLEQQDKVAFFHAGLPIVKRAETARRFRSGNLRVLVTTTSLKMGINTPATHVFVRDTVFMGAGRLRTADILQMLGRAGRGDLPGYGLVVLSGDEGAERYVEDLAENRVSDIEAQLVPREPGWLRNQKDGKETGQPDPILSAILCEIARHDHLALSELNAFFSHTYSFWSETGVLHDYSKELAMLERSKLIYKVENSQATYSPTKLGRTTAFSGLSPESGGMLGGFIRALIRLAQKQHETDGQKHDYLRRLSPMDLLFVTAASFECRQYIPGRISTSRIEEIKMFIESLPPEEKPLLNLWRSANSENYPTRRLLSSLRLPVSTDQLDNERLFYRVMLVAMLLYFHAGGRSLDDLATEYKFALGTLEAGLKHSVTWVLHCLAQICSPEKCYKLNFLSMQSYGLVESLSFGSNLGKLLTIKGVGRKSVQRVLDAGIIDIDGLRGVNSQDLVELGLAAGQAKKIALHVARSGR